MQRGKNVSNFVQINDIDRLACLLLMAILYSLFAQYKNGFSFLTYTQNPFSRCQDSNTWRIIEQTYQQLKSSYPFLDELEVPTLKNVIYSAVACAIGSGISNFIDIKSVYIKMLKIDLAVQRKTLSFNCVPSCNGN